MALPWAIITPVPVNSEGERRDAAASKHPVGRYSVFGFLRHSVKMYTYSHSSTVVSGTRGTYKTNVYKTISTVVLGTRGTHKNNVYKTIFRETRSLFHIVLGSGQCDETYNQLLNGGMGFTEELNQWPEEAES